MNEKNLGQSSTDTQGVELGDLGSSVTQAGVSKSRRRFSGLGLSAPVVLSLVSRPVLGANCLSNMLSGNLSDPDRGTCSLGTSPGGWKNPGGRILGYSTLEAWAAAGYSYGTLKPGSPKGGVKASQWDSYTGGATTKAYPFGILLKNAEDVPLREYLNGPPKGDENNAIIVAYLNAKLSAVSGSTFHYILTPEQVIGLVTGTIPVPSDMPLQVFLSSTW